MYLGVDGGGTKTAFVIVNDAGHVMARSVSGSCYHPEVGIDAVREVLADGVREVLVASGLGPDALRQAFFGIPAYGEDPIADGQLAALPATILQSDRYQVGNDMVCSWAGALACADGISVIAGTGSIAYGEYAGRTARSGGWGEVFGDEGSAYWIAREGLAMFARMSDGRLPPGPLYELMRRHFGLTQDIDLAGRINGLSANERSSIAALATLVAEAAGSGDAAAREVYSHAGSELADIVIAVRHNLAVPDHARVVVSYTGGVFQAGALILDSLADSLALDSPFELAPPRLEPVIGAAMYAARRIGVELPVESLQRNAAA